MPPLSCFTLIVAFSERLTDLNRCAIPVDQIRELLDTGIPSVHFETWLHLQQLLVSSGVIPMMVSGEDGGESHTFLFNDQKCLGVIKETLEHPWLDLLQLHRFHCRGSQSPDRVR